MNRAEAARNAARIRTERGTVLVTCPVCGTEFKAQRSAVERTKIKTCGRECRAKAMSGENNVRWAGGSYIDQRGYRHIKTETGYRLEHRVVMEQMIGRPLAAGEVVHHRNEIPADNRPENLKLYANAATHIMENHATRDAATGRMKSLRDDGPQM